MFKPTIVDDDFLHGLDIKGITFLAQV